METFLIKSGKESKQVPGLRYQIHPKQQVIIVGFKEDVKDEMTITFDIPMGWTSIGLGRLSGQHIIFRRQMLNSLERDQWDFNSCDDPIVILLIDKNAIQMPAPKNGANKNLHKG
jgi:hypothetical protein